MKQNNMTDFTTAIKDKIRIVEIVDGSGKSNNIEYISAKDLNETFQKCTLLIEKKEKDSNKISTFKAKIVSAK